MHSIMTNGIDSIIIYIRVSLLDSGSIGVIESSDG